MTITTVFFDLGSTLVYCKDPWLPIYEQADRAMVGVLRRAGISIDPASFITEFGGFIQSYYQKQYEDNIEPTSLAALRNLLIQKGFPGVQDIVLLKAMEAMYAVTQKNWYREEDAIETLEVLKSRGFRLGIISNTSDDQNVQGIVNQSGLRPYFEYILTSAALGIRKPDMRIFQAALDHFQVPPVAAAMVGDLLQTDVLGANQMGIYSIWITRRARVPEEGELGIQPQAVVTALNQIPPLLVEVERDQTEGFV
jgi:haloacid dehalogenase superfamily, subfamily IA, variant 1 with third motif having Dx(3-4)D or Dx(3-4)E